MNDLFELLSEIVVNMDRVIVEAVLVIVKETRPRVEIDRRSAVSDKNVVTVALRVVRLIDAELIVYPLEERV